MFSRVAAHDPAAAREYEIETALIELLDQNMPERVLGRAATTLAIVGGRRSAERLREAAEARFCSLAKRTLFEVVVSDIEDRLAGVVNRGALTVTDDGSTIGGLSRARARGGALEMSARSRDEEE